MTCPVLRLRRGCAKPIHSGHPWVFAEAVARAEGRPEAGDEVCVVDAQGQVLGHGYYSPRSAIAVRLLTRGPRPADRAWLAARLDAALAFRRRVLKLGEGVEGEETTAFRLVNSEGDGLGGLCVDQYGDYLCLQFGTVGMARRREALLDLLEERLRPRGILDRSDERALRLEGLAPPAAAPLRGRAPEGRVAVREQGLELEVDLLQGQKTGLYLDQRENRRRCAAFASGADVLDAFAYTGAFTLHAARAGARSLTLLDSSEPALLAARANLERNGIADADLCCAEWGDGLRDLSRTGRAYDLLILDPPNFARGKGAAREALNGYAELNALAVRLLRPGGILVTCSCSGSVSGTDFERAVAQGLSRAGRRGLLLETRGAAPDHPLPPAFDQGHYLKCLILAVE